MPVHGLGSTRTLGWTTLTAFIDGTDLHETHVALEFRHDFHVLPHFAPGLCLGQDFIAGQDVSISPARGRARVGHFTFAVSKRADGPPITDLPLVSAAWNPAFRRGCPLARPRWHQGRLCCLASSCGVPRRIRSARWPRRCHNASTRAFVLIGNYGSSAYLLGKGTVMADAVVARIGDVARSSGEVFRLTAAPNVAVSSPVMEPEDPGSATGASLDVFPGSWYARPDACAKVY
ncbi:hypothetical protein CF336_g7821 [Tilletia laevis]|uniref:Uncharacterized protein n=1 Tax=Tilletia caries TaxID=13290 RepID=A0A177V8Y1_9BASI|nr:hypothetical protein CF336_g7821 [Tilletia laevis]KAE8185515.1 hypothetical protein CF328_g7524 [Tilletia controversa]KAE8186386.1 hypothetical protein CF335_g7459 [Tilletia laevis]KAE8243332.1 hypothetical protein A4X03_0g7793 [Tilletia caries]